MQYFQIFFILLMSLLQVNDSLSVETYSSTLNPGGQLDFEKKSIKFKEVISDSRCPEGVTCVWAGEAKVLVEVFKNGQSCGEEVLNIGIGEMNAVSLQQLFPQETVSVLATQLIPYPKIKGKIKSSKYQLRLQIEVTKEGN